MKPSSNSPYGGRKHSLRQYIRAQKKEHTAAQLAAMSEEITNRVLASAWWQEAGTLLLYYPLADEVDVRRLICEAFQKRKNVLLPVVKGEELELHHYEGETSLREGPYGIMEPTGPLFLPESYGDIELALIPGMAFDRPGHRLGRGKGYYDRLLPKLTLTRLTGICFPFQLLDEVPSEPHDIAVAEVIC
ncbi:MAG: 5-formyltetrahydrofolate cyclo-ligase [Bacteroidaceae bacterium]|nr:5-formyltetrahydrofolate cyclo-ligase [Bacteroidaceae bacterium]